MSVAGVLNIDKPEGITSHDVVKQVRRISGLRRVGHAGTLDPLATGVLLICVGRATRLVEYLIGQNKRYVATVRLGQTTDTYDADGALLTESPVTVSAADIEQALVQFRGRIQQKAPSFSAIKRDGQPLYKLARQGKAVNPPIREVHIMNLQLLQWADPFLQLELACSSGTYVRSLAHDLGQALGCGGHITALQRTAVGEFSLPQAVSLPDLQMGDWQNHLLPIDHAVQHLPSLDLSAAEAARVQLGQQLTRQDTHPDAPLVRVYEPSGRFLAILRSKENSWQPHKVFLP
jgi:tRNA pseudouridine55 synthase